MQTSSNPWHLSIKGQQVNPGSGEHNGREEWRKQIRYSQHLVESSFLVTD